MKLPPLVIIIHIWFLHQKKKKKKERRRRRRRRNFLLYNQYGYLAFFLDYSRGEFNFKNTIFKF